MSHARVRVPWRFLILTVVFAAMHAVVLGSMFFLFLVSTGLFGGGAPPDQAPAARASGPLFVVLALPVIVFDSMGVPISRLTLILTSLLYGAIPAALIAFFLGRKKMAVDAPPRGQV